MELPHTQQEEGTTAGTVEPYSYTCPRGGPACFSWHSVYWLAKATEDAVILLIAISGTRIMLIMLLVPFIIFGLIRGGGDDYQ